MRKKTTHSGQERDGPFLKRLVVREGSKVQLYRPSGSWGRAGKRRSLVHRGDEHSPDTEISVTDAVTERESERASRAASSLSHGQGRKGFYRAIRVEQLSDHFHILLSSFSRPNAQEFPGSVFTMYFLCVWGGGVQKRFVHS